jgi:hypothetical protein
MAKLSSEMSVDFRQIIRPYMARDTALILSKLFSICFLFLSFYLFICLGLFTEELLDRKVAAPV